MSDLAQAEKAAMPWRRPRRPLRRVLRDRLYRVPAFRRESGFPYDQYVWVYSRVYAFAMRQVHARGGHRHKRTGPNMDHLWCDWCGDRRGGSS